MTLAQAIPGATPQQFADALLTKWGAPVNATNEGVLERWFNAESSGYNPGSAGGRYNPLNIVVTPGDGHSGQGGSQGDIADFPDLATGVNATAAFFSPTGGTKQQILDALRASNAAAATSAINSFYASWGGGPILSGSSSLPSEATAGTSSTTPDATLLSSGGCPEGNLVTFPGPIPNISRCEGRALLGAASLAGGALIMVLGAIAMSKTATGAVASIGAAV